MIGTDSNHCRIVNESLNGEREVDDYTFAALAVLSERLDHLKKLDEAYSGITFSPAVEELQRQAKTVHVS
jgi:hypothetical protein